MKISIRDFQSLGQTEIEATGLTVVVGRSNLGKSALVRAITAALFNRPGEDFIRLNRTNAAVTIEGLPTIQKGTMRVEWLKGHNLNQFTVNGTLFNKVGVDAPPVIGQAGYRDVFIGDKERGKGEEIRPQIAGQFESPFLISKLGSFVNDVLSVVSRLGVLLNANGRCAKDLKAAKALLTTRKKDLTAAEAKVVSLQPITDLHTRVEALQATIQQAQKDAALVAKVKALVAGRAALKAFCTTALPDHTTVPADLGVKEVALQRLTVARKTLAPIVGVELPPETAYPLDTLHAGAQNLTRAQPLIAIRPGLVTVSQMTLPEDELARLSGLLEKCDTQVKVATDVRDKLEQQGVASGVVFKAISVLNGVTDMQTEADAALVTALSEIEICPICDRPMEKAAAAV